MDEVLHTRGLDESARTTGRRSARNRPIEIITRGERRCSWTLEQKREIVAESLGSELTPAEVARKHAISSGQLYTWRQQLLSTPSTVLELAAPRFAEMDLASASPDASQPASISETAPPGLPAPAHAGGMIEIMLAEWRVAGASRPRNRRRSWANRASDRRRCRSALETSGAWRPGTPVGCGIPPPVHFSGDLLGCGGKRHGE